MVPAYRTSATRLVVVVAVIEMLQGLSLYALPREFQAAAYDPLRPYFAAFSALAVAGGVVLLILRRFRLPLPWRRLLFLVPLAPLLILAALFAAAGVWTGTVAYGSLSAGLVAAALQRHPDERPARPPDLYARVLALALAATGALMLARPDLLAAPSYDPIRPALPFLGAGGLAGAAAALVPRPLAGRGRALALRLVAATLPLGLAYTLLATGIWTGVMAWGVLGLALLVGDRWLAPAPVHPLPFQDGADPAPAVERALEFWTWLLALLVVGTTAVGGEATLAPPLVATLFVLAISLYNGLAYLAFPSFGSAGQRVWWHLCFLTAVMGVFLGMAGALGHSLLAALALVPPLAARTVSPAAGRRLLALSVLAVAVGEGVDGRISGDPWAGVALEAAVEGLILWLAAGLGLRTSEQLLHLLVQVEQGRRALAAEVRVLTLVDRIGAAIRGSLAVDQVVAAAAAGIGHALGADRCLIRLRQPDGTYPVQHEWTAPGVAPVGERLGPMTPALRIALAQREVLAVADAWADPRLADPAGGGEVYRQVGARGILGAPILAGGELLGVVGLHHVRGPRTWRDEEIRSLRALAGQLGVALSHARVHAELAAGEELLRTAFAGAPIGMALVDLNGRFLRVNGALCTMLGYDEGGLLATGYAGISFPANEELRRRAARALLKGEASTYQAELRFRRRDGTGLWVQVSASLVRDPVGRPQHYILHVQDITERRRTEAQLVQLAMHDSLTGLLNRHQFQVEVEQALAAAGSGAVLFLDLDQFKDVNDTLGHRAGDELLRAVAGFLVRQAPAGATAARLGGDEFALLLPGASANEALDTARRLAGALRQQVFVVAGKAVGVTASIGAARFPDHGTSVEDLLAHADAAMYTVKGRGRDDAALYTPDPQRQRHLGARLQWERQLRAALEQDRFVLHAQPIVDLQTGQTVAHELLLRLLDDDGRLIYPGAFLDVAERYGLIHAIDRWVLRRGLALLGGRQQQGVTAALAVNLSGRAFTDPDLEGAIAAGLQAHGVPPGRLILEVTETAAIADLDQAWNTMAAIQRLGCHWALDDFGAGFSSLLYLRQLPVHYIKIDGTFVRNLPRNRQDQHMVRAIVELARGLGKRTIAEGVEDGETLRLLATLGVDMAQGYHLGSPAPLPVRV